MRSTEIAIRLEQQAARMHDVAAQAHDQVAAFAARVVRHEPDIAARTGIDPEKFRERAVAERARAQRARDRLAEDLDKFE